MNNRFSLAPRTTTKQRLTRTFGGVLLLSGIFGVLSVMEDRESLRGIVNEYAAVTYLHADTVLVEAPNPFQAGDQLLLMQMQGAIISRTNDATYGNVQDAGNSGQFAMREVAKVEGNRLILTAPICDSFTTAPSIQALRVPTHTRIHVDSTITAPSWNGSTGGVVAIHATESILLSANINVIGCGFRGGSFNGKARQGGETYVCDLSSGKGGIKGEGIAGIDTLGCRGKNANGGGGGNDHNGGGGGGSGYGEGGIGGHGWRSNRSGQLSDLDKGGRGGEGIASLISTSQTRLFLGGGGGGGHQNNGASFPAGHGGGIIILITPTLIADTSVVLKAKGKNAKTHSVNDGASGGGGGGSILLDVDSIENPNNLTLNVAGGKGASVQTRDQHGPGGGGGGGLIHSVYPIPSGVRTRLGGGTPGLFITSNTSNPHHNTPHGATPGAPGAVMTGDLACICPNELYLDLDQRMMGTSGEATFDPAQGDVRLFPAEQPMTLGVARSTDVSSLTVTILNPSDGNAESLDLDWPADSLLAYGLSYAYDSMFHELTIQGQSSTGTYLRAMTGLLYQNRASSPATTGREIEVQAYDGTNFSNQAVSYVQVVSGNLPVEWLSFDAVWAGQDASLSWATAQEINSASFVIERAVDQTSFQAVGEVRAAGNSTEILSYTFTDVDAARQTGQSLVYRLKQLDLDGQFDYSSSVELTLDAVDQPFQVSVYPNPLMSRGTIRVMLDGPQMLSWRVLSSAGQLMQQQAQQMQAGRHELPLTATSWPAGVYFLEVSAGYQRRTIAIRKE